MEAKSSELRAKLEHEKHKHSSYGEELAAVEKSFAAAEKEVTSVQRSVDKAQDDFKEFERKDAKARLHVAWCYPYRLAVPGNGS